MAEENLRKIKIAVIREEYVEITKHLCGTVPGKDGEEIKTKLYPHILAIILNQFVFWTKGLKEFDDLLTEEENLLQDKNLSEIKRFGWIFKKASDLKDAIMVDISEVSIRTYIKALVDGGFLSQRNNPKHKWDRVLQYRVNLNHVHWSIIENGFPGGIPLPDYTYISKGRNLNDLGSENNGKVSNLNDLGAIHKNKDKEEYKEDSLLHKERLSPESRKSVDEKENKQPELLPEAVKVFAYWNDLGSPLTKHIVPAQSNNWKQTKIYKQASEAIKKELKRGHTLQQILDSIYYYYNMLTLSDEYKLSPAIPGHNVDLAAFFKFDRSWKESFSDNNIAKSIDGWFWECVRGEEYLNNKYRRFGGTKTAVEDKHPQVTEKLKKAWGKEGYQNSNPQDENNFRKAANRFVDFIDEHWKRFEDYGWPMGQRLDKPQSVVHHIIKAIEWSTRDNEDLAITTSWLCSDTTFKYRLPDYFYDQGLFKN